MSKGRIHSFVNDHPAAALLLVFAVVLIVTPFDEVLIVAAVGFFGVVGLLVLFVLIVLFFLASRRWRFGQRWWGRAYGTLEGWMTRWDNR